MESVKEICATYGEALVQFILNDTFPHQKGIRFYVQKENRS